MQNLLSPWYGKSTKILQGGRGLNGNSKLALTCRKMKGILKTMVACNSQQKDFYENLVRFLYLSLASAKSPFRDILATDIPTHIVSHKI